MDLDHYYATRIAQERTNHQTSRASVHPTQPRHRPLRAINTHLRAALHILRPAQPTTATPSPAAEQETPYAAQHKRITRPAENPPSPQPDNARSTPLTRDEYLRHIPSTRSVKAFAKRRSGSRRSRTRSNVS